MAAYDFYLDVYGVCKGQNSSACDHCKNAYKVNGTLLRTASKEIFTFASVNT